MGIFGKKKISESDAVAHFVHDMIKLAIESWGTISAQLNELITGTVLIPNDDAATSEFALAIIFTQMQTVSDLLPSEQTRRIHERIRAVISSEVGQWAIEALDEYVEKYRSTLVVNQYFADKIKAHEHILGKNLVEASRNASDANKLLFSETSRVLFRRLGCLDELWRNDHEVVLLLGLGIVQLPGWWKRLLREYKVLQS